MKSIVKASMVVCVLSFVSLANAGDTAKEAIKESKLYAQMRIRYEVVDQDSQALITKNAHSRTARTRVGIKSGEFKGFSALVEGEYVIYLGPDNYNDTVNRRVEYPVVADPENIQLNQIYAQYTGIPDTTIRGGRQVIEIDNQRFIGSVGWRQNNQVFDAAIIANSSITNTEIKYGYIYNVNRIFGEQSIAGDWRSKSHFYNISNSSLPIGKVTTYGYFLDFGNDSASNSSQTYGFSLNGDFGLSNDTKFRYYGEYAHQSDFADHATKYDADYFHIAPAIVWQGLTTTVGYEVLGSDNRVFAFQTPLATGHKFNGWADKFLITPVAGLEDMYFDLNYKVTKLKGNLKVINGLMVNAQYHNFSAENGGMNYGNEIGVFLKKPIHEHVTTSVKYAYYDADEYLTDTQKITFDIEILF
ncbi:MAG: alginate export family protein [Candidatus Omnitrophica bacterium]|nr:alginate export family protein [Candidatus Omnitrophota bacterium]